MMGQSIVRNTALVLTKKSFCSFAILTGWQEAQSVIWYLWRVAQLNSFYIYLQNRQCMNWNCEAFLWTAFSVFLSCAGEKNLLQSARPWFQSARPLTHKAKRSPLATDCGLLDIWQAPSFCNLKKGIKTKGPFSSWELIQHTSLGGSLGLFISVFLYRLSPPQLSLQILLQAVYAGRLACKDKGLDNRILYREPSSQMPILTLAWVGFFGNGSAGTMDGSELQPLEMSPEHCPMS